MSSGYLGEHLDNTFFKVIACIDTVVVLIMWLWVSGKCIQQTIDGRLFFEKGFHESSSKKGLDETQKAWKRNVCTAESREGDLELSGDTDGSIDHESTDV